MALLRDKDSQRLHIESRLMGESLVSQSFIDNLRYDVKQFRSFPDVAVVKIGGQSITDLGARGVLPVIREIAENTGKHRMIISTGGGTRSRHIYAIAMELGMPVGIISKLGQSVSEQNALMISTLLSPHGGIKIGHDDIPKLGGYFAQGCTPVIHGMPPYGYWEHPPKEGSIPPNRTDVGAFLLAEVIGARQCIFIKDEDGLYTDNPKKNQEVQLIPRIGAGALMDLNLDDLIVERTVLELLQCARSIHEIQIINGLKPGFISRALDGEHVGTIIFKDR